MGDMADGEDRWGVRPGKVWLVPLGEDGEPMGEPQEMTGVNEFSWGESLGLHGGLEGGLDGALGQDDRLVMSRGLTFSLEFSIGEGEGQDEVRALLWGMTLAEYRDFRLWLVERKWLSGVTGLSWGLT